MTVEGSASRIPYKACPLCKSGKLKAVKSVDCTKYPNFNPALGGTMTWMQCEGCTHVFTQGYFTPEAFALLVSKAHEGQVVGANVEATRKTWATIVEKISSFRPSADGFWLDVGFGDGSLLFTAAEWGYTVVGLDIRTDNVAAMRLIGFEAHAADLTSYSDFGRFDVISFADALEHMPFPTDALAHAHKLLKADGILFLSMPNMDTIVWRAWDQTNVNPYWTEMEHYHNFSRKRLYALCAEYGFVPVHYDVSQRYRSCMEVVFRKKA
jgi:protein O-GlcNAc transferase